MNQLPYVKPSRAPANLAEQDNQPAEPTLCSRAGEALSYLDQLRDSLATLRSVVFGEAEQGIEKSAPMPSHLEGMLREIATRSACLTGELRTIVSRL